MRVVSPICDIPLRSSDFSRRNNSNTAKAFHATCARWYTFLLSIAEVSWSNSSPLAWAKRCLSIAAEYRWCPFGTSRKPPLLYLIAPAVATSATAGIALEKSNKRDKSGFSASSFAPGSLGSSPEGSNSFCLAVVSIISFLFLVYVQV